MNGFRILPFSGVLLAMCCVGFAPHANAQARPSGDGTGARYGTRDPWVCASRKAPESGPISAQQAAIYVMCGPRGDNPKSVSDGEARSGTYLNLVDDVQLEVGRPHRASELQAFYATDIDRSALVYPIQGTYSEYQCSGTASDVKGRNCLAYISHAGRGYCYKDNFSNWHCDLSAAESGHPQPNHAGPH